MALLTEEELARQIEGVEYTKEDYPELFKVIEEIATEQEGLDKKEFNLPSIKRDIE